MQVTIHFFSRETPFPELTTGAGLVFQTLLSESNFSLSECGLLLTTEERARAERFRHPRPQEQFLRTRGLLRLLLGHYLQLSPERVPIEIAPDGKPTLQSSLPLHFNLSHTHDLALIAVAPVPVGVDVEGTRELSNRDQLVERFFSPIERDEYQNLPVHVRQEAFFRGWTCKEAVLKGIGCGTRDLNRCLVRLDPRVEPAITGPEETRSQWSLATWVPAPGFHAAIAAQTAKKLEITVLETAKEKLPGSELGASEPGSS